MTKDHSGLRRISIILFFVMLVVFVAHIQILALFNQRELGIHGNSGGPTYMEIDARANSTSQWLKRDYPLTVDEKVDLIGQTVDGTLYNNSGDLIRDWGLRINILGNCFINQCWNGTVEIHQYVGSGREAVQTLNLQDYLLEKVKLQYRYDGDLLIPLQKGDYIIYYPNTGYSEMPLRSGDKITIGMIFYYLTDLDLSDYDLTVHYYRTFTQGWSFIAFAITAVLWILSLVMYITNVLTYRSAQKQMELRRSSLSYMSELYEAIYMINLPTDEVIPVSTGEYVETLRAKIGGAQALLRTAVENDADDNYLDEAVAFVNLQTLPERMKDRKGIVIEFISREHGWCRIRFFPMEQEEDKPLENVIFAVQDINDERSEAKELAAQLEKTEERIAANNDFLFAVSRDLRAPLRELMSLDEQLLQETETEKIRQRAEEIKGTAGRMMTLLDGLADRAALAGGSVPVSERYSLKQVLTEALQETAPLAAEKGLPLETSVTETLPDPLFGDAGKLKESIVSLLSSVLKHTGDSTVRLSVFGRVVEDTVHLLFSVQALPKQEHPADITPAPESGRKDTDLNLEVAESLLTGLNTGLRSVRSPDEWKNVYFEIDQRIAGTAPVGSISMEDLLQ